MGEKLPIERSGAAFSPDGKTIAVSDGATNAVFWDVATGNKVGMLSGIHRATDTLIFMPDGQSLLTARTVNSADVQVWDVSGILHPKGAVKK